MSEFDEVLDMYGDMVEKRPVTDSQRNRTGFAYELFDESEYPSESVFVPRSEEGVVYLDVSGDGSYDKEVTFDGIDEFREWVMDLYMTVYAPDTVQETPDEEAARWWVESTDRFKLDEGVISRA